MDLKQNLYVLSRPPTQQLNKKLKNIKTKESNFNESNSFVTYNHLKIVNFSMFKHIYLFITCFFNALQWNFKNRKYERAIISDPLNLSVSMAALLIAKIFKVKSTAIITDIPAYMEYTTIKKESFPRKLFLNCYSGICNFFMQRYDSYIFLTEQMNDLINPSNRPYVVIEGLVDVNMRNTPNILEDKYKEKIVIYAGALYEKYGVKKLLQAFMALKESNTKLWIYGAGEMEEYIKKCEIEDNRIKFFGVMPNEHIVNEQLKATVLVNPRPSYEEFTKYSFPSKNMEYMVSGTPVLTTPLQGMPYEYNDYVYLFEDETLAGITRTLENILGKKREELHEKGVKAKEFVIREKNNQIQANKIICLIKSSKQARLQIN
ncbi:glycosyltransferase [Lysinibacillus sp. 2017]|uniref:glycosyltransferase n=2 Tax=unclassified Lysinibacillus TaxID=2636778 RepID=UPI0018FF98E0|nr:glycosyltransferase [Lysinibacillus sp. 2017]